MNFADNVSIFRMRAVLMDSNMLQKKISRSDLYIGLINTKRVRLELDEF